MNGSGWNHRVGPAEGLSRRPAQRLALAAVLPWLLLITSTRGAEVATGVALFETAIRPLLVDSCYGCHSAGPKGKKGGLAVDTRPGILTGGNAGPAVIPGKPDESPLYLAITGAQGFDAMPPKKKLSAAAIANVRRWIEIGAPDPRNENSKSLTPSGDASWWSLRPLAEPPVPHENAGQTGWARTPVDRFILAELGKHGLYPAPEADRRTLIRRLSFDLIGLPPTPEELSEFVNDQAADAFERLVNRLLASPHYGERWARHWMDVVHFAETHGHDQDRIRPNAWPYRDYLIAAFNQDVPYPRFVSEQVAADALFPDEPRLTPALGMIAAGPWDESSLRDIRDDSIDRQIGYYIDRDDMVATVMSTFVSSTVQCARCHDHKFDPISQADYYSLQAVFAGVDKAECLYDESPAVARTRRTLESERKRLPDPASPRIGWIAAQLGALPPRISVFAAAADFPPDASHKPPGVPRPVYILRRGDINQPGAPARPGTMGCVAGLASRFECPPGDESSRRAALARWIVDPRNSLTWRSIVNRIWHYHFGRGLVATPNDFGRMGALPTHPELLDWLALRLLESGGSLKQLHRLIVTSAVYRQSSRSESSLAANDADDRWLWRHPRRRLDAESVRDAILACAGRLDTTMRGPSVRQFQLGPGVHVTPVVDYTRYDWNSPGSGRRAVYRFLFRTLPDPFFDALDSADASQLTAVRNESNTPLQALVLWNDPFVLNECVHLANRLESRSPDRYEQIRALYALVLGREPTGDELGAMTDFARRHGLENVCRAVFNSNEFLFVN
jgi:hypothetical protein